MRVAPSNYMRNNPLAASLYELFLNSPKFARLITRVNSSKEAKGNELNISGLTDSAKTLILSVMQHQVKKPLVMICQDNHSAAHYHQEFTNLSRFKVLWYPASEVSPYEQVLSGPDNVAAQMEVLRTLSDLKNNEQSEPYVIIVAARALMQRVLDADTLSRNTVRLKVGENINTDKLATDLVKLGYSRETLVTLRGEFSIRGDIVDIYPSSGPPVRVELFGDEVESIRLFNIDNQRSFEENKVLEIPPRWWIVLDEHEDSRTKLAERLREAARIAIAKLEPNPGDTLRSIMDGDLEAIESGAYPESIEYYAPYISDKFATLIDYLPADAILAIDEYDSIAQSLSSFEEKIERNVQEGLETGRLLPLPRKLHLEQHDVVEQLKPFQKAYLSSLPIFDPELAGSESAQKMVIDFNSVPIQKFGNDMSKVMTRVKEARAAGKAIIISTDQPQRLMGLLREWDCLATYLPTSDDATPVQTDVQDTGHSGKVFVTRNGFIHGFSLEEENIVSITDGEMFGLKRKPTVYRKNAVEKNVEKFTSVADLTVGDYVVHIKQGIGQFTGIQRLTVDNQQREYLTVQYSGDDKLYVPVDQIHMLSRYRGAGDHAPRLSKLGGSEWENTKKKVKKSVRRIAEDLVNLYALRAKQVGFQSLPDTPWQYEMEEGFPFEETPDQWQAIMDVKKDLESDKPMDRLILGDVGFGKTEVAIRGIFKMVMSGKQAAVLVPTTILAQQHFNNISDRFAAYPIRVGLLNRFRTPKEQREVVRRLGTGECDVVVGTHRMLQKDMSFKDLGLVVIDEEHRFGVAHKEKLKQLRVAVDVLTMSATPIPRTLHMALSGVRDLSNISTPPSNRNPVKTFVGEYKLPLVRTAILHELERGGQIYFVHNRVESIEQVAMELKDLVPEARINIGHGQMPEHELENVMLAFNAHEFDILVCTTIIESGLDIPNSNTIIIDDADKFGLAQLYQLRGRVGRSDVQAYCYCLYKPQKILSDQAQSRLKAVREFTSLGSGYMIAMRDMEIRGVGNILGAEQHGHMVSVGYDLYCKLLDESVSELKGAPRSATLDSQIDLNVTAYLPETYVQDNRQRLIEYKRLADVVTMRELELINSEWRDRFGKIPDEAQQLMDVVKLRMLASDANISAIKPDFQGIRLSVSYRLQQWLPIQNKLPKHLSRLTTYKPGQAGGQGAQPSVIVKVDGLSAVEQLNLLIELISSMLSFGAAKTT